MIAALILAAALHSPPLLTCETTPTQAACPHVKGHGNRITRNLGPVTVEGNGNTVEGNVTLLGPDPCHGSCLINPTMGSGRLMLEYPPCGTKEAETTVACTQWMLRR